MAAIAPPSTESRSAAAPSVASPVAAATASGSAVAAAGDPAASAPPRKRRSLPVRQSLSLQLQKLRDEAKVSDEPPDVCPQPSFAELRPVKVGVLHKQGRRNEKSFKSYVFALEGPLLFYFVSSGDVAPRGALWVRGCEVAEDKALGALRGAHCFRVRAKRSWKVLGPDKYEASEDVTLNLYAPTFFEMNEWMTLVGKAS